MKTKENRENCASENICCNVKKKNIQRIGKAMKGESKAKLEGKEKDNKIQT